MAFWGIEVKPGKPYTHLYDNARGRLRVCQATLGNGKSTSKSVVQCNVGNKSPILLCSLIPDVSETCHMELEFEEEEEVIFSVLGQRSVHLSGYYIGSSSRNLGGDETDSYGVDIAETDSSGSYSSHDTDDEYESDFIDDGDIEMYPPSSRRKSGVVIEEIIEDDKPSNGNANRRRLKKKHQLSDSDDGDVGLQHQLVVKHNNSAVLESEDEDGFPISFSSRRKIAPKDSEGNSNSDDKTVDEDKKRKISAVSQVGGATRDPCDTSLPSEIGVENNEKSKKKKKTRDGKPIETGTKASAEERVSGELNPDRGDKDVGVQNDGVQFGEAKGETNVVEVNGAENDKPKKKKEKVKKGKKSEADVDVSVERTEEDTRENPNEAMNNDIMDQDPPVCGEPEKLPTDNEVVDPSVPSATAQETSAKLKRKNKKKRSKDKNSQENQKPTEAKLDTDDSKLQISEVMELPNDKGSDVEADKAAAVNQNDAKKKKKKSKNRDKDLVPNQELSLQGKSDEPKAGAHSLKTRTFANGLVIEELAMGKPDGKRASPGNKVSVIYIGKLKNGTIFDSNVGQKPFKFRLGVGQVIKGWDIGVNGMRVGDKRRLTIPPSFGYGEKGAGKTIPGNSWLLFDVELVAVQ